MISSIVAARPPGGPVHVNLSSARLLSLSALATSVAAAVTSA